MRVFLSYAAVDGETARALETHLLSLEKRGALSVFHRGRIDGGATTDHVVREARDVADVFLFVLSADFFATDELQEDVDVALRRQAQVIPVLARAVAWESSSLARYRPIPASRRPLTELESPDSAFVEVVTALDAYRRSIDGVSSGPDGVDRKAAGASVASAETRSSPAGLWPALAGLVLLLVVAIWWRAQGSEQSSEGATPVGTDSVRDAWHTDLDPGDTSPPSGEEPETEAEGSEGRGKSPRRSTVAGSDAETDAAKTTGSSPAAVEETVDASDGERLAQLELHVTRVFQDATPLEGVRIGVTDEPRSRLNWGTTNPLGVATVDLPAGKGPGHEVELVLPADQSPSPGWRIYFPRDRTSIISNAFRVDDIQLASLADLRALTNAPLLAESLDRGQIRPIEQDEMATLRAIVAREHGLSEAQLESLVEFYGAVATNASDAILALGYQGKLEPWVDTLDGLEPDSLLDLVDGGAQRLRVDMLAGQDVEWNASESEWNASESEGAPLTADAVRVLGDVFLALGQVEGALRILHWGAIQWQDPALMLSSATVLRAMVVAGEVDESTLRQAEQLGRSALDALRHQGVSSASAVYAAHGNVAATLLAQGKVSEAVESQTTALRGFERVLRPGDPRRDAAAAGLEEAKRLLSDPKLLAADPKPLAADSERPLPLILWCLASEEDLFLIVADVGEPVDIEIEMTTERGATMIGTASRHRLDSEKMVLLAISHWLYDRRAVSDWLTRNLGPPMLWPKGVAIRIRDSSSYEYLPLEQVAARGLAAPGAYGKGSSFTVVKQYLSPWQIHLFISSKGFLPFADLATRAEPILALEPEGTLDTLISNLPRNRLRDVFAGCRDTRDCLGRLRQRVGRSEVLHVRIEHFAHELTDTGISKIELRDPSTQEWPGAAAGECRVGGLRPVSFPM